MPRPEPNELECLNACRVAERYARGNETYSELASMWSAMKSTAIHGSPHTRAGRNAAWLAWVACDDDAETGAMCAWEYATEDDISLVARLIKLLEEERENDR